MTYRYRLEYVLPAILRDVFDALGYQQPEPMRLSSLVDDAIERYTPGWPVVECDRPGAMPNTHSKGRGSSR